MADKERILITVRTYPGCALDPGQPYAWPVCGEMVCDCSMDGWIGTGIVPCDGDAGVALGRGRVAVPLFHPWEGA